jgi:hypothetical protein
MRCENEVTWKWKKFVSCELLVRGPRFCHDILSDSVFEHGFGPTLLLGGRAFISPLAELCLTSAVKIPDEHG